MLQKVTYIAILSIFTITYGQVDSINVYKGKEWHNFGIIPSLAPQAKTRGATAQKNASAFVTSRPKFKTNIAKHVDYRRFNLDSNYETDFSESVELENASRSEGINSLAQETFGNGEINQTDLIQGLMKIGKKVYNRQVSVQDFVMPKDRLDKRYAFKPKEGTRFLFKTPTTLDYHLVDQCISTIYIAAYVDGNGIVHVDGASDSLVAKGVLALVLNHVNLKPLTSVLEMQSTQIPFHKEISRVGIVKRNGIETILNFIKDRCSSQTSSPLQSSLIPRYVLKAPTYQQKRVAVLLSGGVDSSVALWLLKNRGYHVEAFYLKVWGITPDEALGDCQWATDIEYCREVCKALEVPLHVLPFDQIYKVKIVEPFVNASRMGETPNPDVECNCHIKFGEFLDYARQWGFHFVATGHYAKVVNQRVDATSNEKIACLSTATDVNKDQTYFMSRLTQQQLQHLLLPIGEFNKTQIRQIARDVGLVTSERPDSTGLCFLGNVDIGNFLEHKIGNNPGPIVDYETHKRIGTHPGLYRYTVGQRENISKYIDTNQASVSRNVVAKDPKTNTLYVSTLYHTKKYVDEGGLRRTFHVNDIQWNVPHYLQLMQSATQDPQDNNAANDNKESPKVLHPLKIKTRHMPRLLDAKVEFDHGYKSAWVSLKQADVGIATGQYAVFYVKNLCIGAGKMQAPNLFN